MEKSFTREDTRAIKGIAVLMLLVGHLWPFEDRRPVGFEWCLAFGLVDPRWVSLVGWAAHITLYVFLFLGGYGLYHQLKRGTPLKDVLLRLYINYWRIFVIFVPVAFLFFSNQPTGFMADTSLCNIYSHFTLRDLAMNFLGLEFTFNKEWWFISVYAAATVTGSLLIMATDKNRSFWLDAFIVIAIGVLIAMVSVLENEKAAFIAMKDNYVFKNLVNTNAVPFYMGIVFAKHNGLVKMRGMVERYSKPMQIFIALCGLFIIYIVRQTEIVTYDLDVVIVPFLVVCFLVLIDAVKPVKTALGYIGKHCNNIWLIHSFYCFYFYPVQRLVFCTRDPLIALAILLGLSLASSIAVEWFYKKVNGIGKKLRGAAAGGQP